MSTAARAAWLGAIAFAGAVIGAVVRARTGGWYPVGDNAYFALRSRDVLTEHHPLLGTWTSASQSVGFNLNNPGPLLFDVLALPAKIDSSLLPVGVAVLVLASVAVAAWCASRVAGALGVVGVLFASSALAWAMGPELLIDPWQPHALLFPYLGALVAAWAVIAGWDRALLAFVALGSLLVQTHLSYAPLVLALGAVALVTVLVSAIRWPDRRRGHGTTLALAALLGLALWSQPIIEQLTADGRGNLSRVADLAGADTEDLVGGELGIQVAGHLLSPVPRWLPPSFEDAYENVPTVPANPPSFERLPSTAVAALSIGGALVVLAALAAGVRRRAVVAGAGVMGLVLLVSVVTIVSLPLSTYGLPPHHIRWLWPSAIALTTVLVGAALATRVGLAVVTLAAVAMAGLAVVPAHPAIGPTADRDAGPPMRALAPQLDALRGRGPLELDLRGLRLFEPYSISVVLELDERGVDVTVSDPGMIRQLGDARAATGEEAGRLFVLQGDLAVDGFEGATQEAFVAGLDEAEQSELERLGERVAGWIAAGDVALTDAGRTAVRSGRLPDLAEVVAAGEDALVVRGPGLVRMGVEHGFLASAGNQAEVERWAGLQRRYDRQTVAVWVDWADPAA